MEEKQIRRLQVDAQGGNDTVVNNTSVPSFIAGGDGDDTLYGGQSTDLIFGGSGNDAIYGRGGIDYLFSDHAYDAGATPRIVEAALANDEVLSGGGVDWLIYRGDDLINAGGSSGEGVVDVDGRASIAGKLLARIYANIDTVLEELEAQEGSSLATLLFESFPGCV